MVSSGVGDLDMSVYGLDKSFWGWGWWTGDDSCVFRRTLRNEVFVDWDLRKGLFGDVGLEEGYFEWGIEKSAGFTLIVDGVYLFFFLKKGRHC